MRTGFRNHGYYGHTFVGARLLSAIALLAIIGLVAGFASQINKASLAPPVQLTGAIVVSAAALLWVLLSFTAYDDTHIPYMATAVVDTVFLIPFVVVVIVLGGQLSQTECSTLPESGNGTTLQLDPADSAGNGTLSYVTFVASDRMTCYKLQGTWGLSIALCILFLLSALAAAFLFMGKRKNGYKGKFFGKNSARFGKGKPIKGYKSPETWTSQNVNGTRSAGPASPKKNKKSKQKKQKNGQNQASSYDKGYSFFKPSTWYSSDKSSANSSSATSRGVNNPGSSGNSSSAQNVSINNQAPHSTPSKNNAEPQNGSNETTGKWYFGFGRLWRKGGGRRDGRDRSKNTAPPGHQQEDIVLTDVPRGRRNDPNTTDSNNNRDLGGPQGESKGMGFLGLFRSKDKSRDHSSTSPQTNRSLDPQGRPQQTFPPNSNQAANSAGPLQGAADADADTNMPGKRQVPPAPNGRGNGRPGPNTAGKVQPPLAGASSSKGPIPNGINNTKAGVNGIPPQRKGGPAPPLNQGPNVPPEALKRGKVVNVPPAVLNGKNNAGIANVNNPKSNPNIKGKMSAGAAPLNLGPNGQTLQRKQAGEFKTPVPGQPLPPNRNGQPLRPGERAPMANEPSAKLGGGLFSNIKNPLKPAQEKKGNEILPDSSTHNIPNKQKEGRGPLMPDLRNPGRPNHGNSAAPQQNLAPRPNPDQQDESRGFLRGKKGANPPYKGLQPQENRPLTAAELEYRKTPLNPAAEQATRRGKTLAEKKGEMESKPHTLHSQKNSFESEAVTGAPAFAAGNVPPNKQAKQPAGQGRPEPPAGRNAQAGLHPHAAPQPERDARGRLLPEAQRRPGPPGSEAKANPLGQPAPGSLPAGQFAKGQGPPPQIRDGQDLRAGERPGPAKDIKGGLPARDEKGRPVPPLVGRGPPGAQQPMFDERGRPLPQRAAGGPAGGPGMPTALAPAQPPQGPPARLDRSTPGGQQPMVDERGRPLPQRAAGGPLGGPGMPAALAPAQPPQGPPVRLDARGQPFPPHRPGQFEVPGAPAPGAKNPRDPPTMPNEPKQPMPPARNERGRPLGPAPEPAVPSTLALGRNMRDDRGRPAPQKQGQGRDIPNALLPGGRTSHESARDAKAPGERRPQSPSKGRPPSPSKLRGPPGLERRQDEVFAGDMPPKNIGNNGRPMPPVTEASNLPARNMQEQGRPVPPPGARGPSEPLPLPPSLRDPAIRGPNGAEDRPPMSKDGRPMPPFAEKSLGPQPPRIGGERERGRQIPPFLGGPSARGEAPASQSVPTVPAQNQPTSRDGRPMPPMPPMSHSQDRSLGSEPPFMRNDRGRPMPPAVPGERSAAPAAISNASAARERSRSRPPPMLRERKSLFQPGMPAQDAGAAPMPRMPSPSRGGPRDMPSEFATPDSLRPGRGNEKDGTRIPVPPTNGQMPPPREPGLAGFGAPLRDDPRAPRVDERNMPGQLKAPINPWEKKSAANDIPGPFANSFNEPRQLRSDPRDPRRPQGPQGPKDMGQPPLPMGMKADGRGGQAPPFPSRDEQMNGETRPSTSSSRDMNVGKLDTNVPGRNTPSAEPSSATGSPSKGGWMGRLFGKKNKKQAEPMTTSNIPTEPLAKRPSLLPPGRERRSVETAAAAVQPDQSGRTPLTQQQEVRPDQQSRDLNRGPNDLPPFQPVSDGPHKSLVNTSIPHSRDGQQHPPPEPSFRESRARASPFPMRPAANNPNEYDPAAAAARDLNRDKQDEPKIPEPKEQKKMNRKSHVLAGMMPPMPGQGDAMPMPVPAVPQTPAAYKDGDERPTTPGGTQMPPAPVLNDKQRRAANRKSHMNGFGPADVQMPPVPSLPEQPPARKDDVAVNSDLPSSMRPGVSEVMPQGQRDLAGEFAKDKPGMVPPPPMGLRRGLPSRPMPRGAGKDSAQPTGPGLPPPPPPPPPPAGLETELLDSSQDSRLPPALRPGRPDLKLDANNGEQLPPPPGSLPEPMSKSRDMRPNMMGMPASPKSKKAKGGKDRDQTRQPLSPLDGNMSPRSPLGAETRNMPPLSQKPSSPKSNKLKDLFGKTKGKNGVSREIDPAPMASEKPLSPTSKLADIEKEMDSISSRNEQPPPRFSDSSFTEDMLNTPPLPNNGFASDKGMNRKDVNGQTLKDASRSFADRKNGRLDSAPFSSLANDDRTSKKNKSRGLPGDKQDESTVNGEPKRDFFGGLFGGKDQMSPMGSPTFRDDEPWAAGKDTKASGDNEPGFFDFGSDKKKDRKQLEGSRGLMSGSPTFIDDAPRSPGQGERWSNNGDVFDEKSSSDKKAPGLFGRGKDKSKTGYKSPTDEKHGLLGLGKGKDKHKDRGDDFQSGSPVHSPTIEDGSPIEPWVGEETLADGQKLGEKKNGLFSHFGKGKDKKNTSGSPLGSPTLRDSSAMSPGLESSSMNEDGTPGSKDKGTGLFSSFGKDKKQRRGSKSGSISGDRDSILLDSADGELDESAPGEKKSGLKGLFSKDKDGRNKRGGLNSGSLSPGKQDSALGSPTTMGEQQTGYNDEIVIPALLVVQQGRSQPGSPVLPGQEKTGQLDGHFVDEENDENFSSLSEADKKKKKGKGLFGFGKNKNKNEDGLYDDVYDTKSDRPVSPQLEFPVSPEFGQKDKKSKHRDSSLSNLDDIYTDQDGRPLSPQLEFPASPDMGKKDKKGKGLFGRFGKNKDGEMTPTSLDGFNDHGAQPLSPQDDLSLSPDVGKKDKDGKGIFGWGKKKNRDSPLASPMDDDFNHGGMSPRSPESDQHQSSDMDSFPAMAAQSPILEDSMGSPRRSFDGGNSPPLDAYEEPISSGEPEKMKPAPLNFKNKMRNFFDKVGGVGGEERDHDKRRSSRDFGGASGAPYSPSPGGMDSYSTNNMPPSPAGGMDDFGGNNSIPPSPAGGMDNFGGSSMPPSPAGGMGNVGGDSIPPSPAGGMDNLGGNSMPPSPSLSMDAGAAPMPMESPVQSPMQSP
ncbi:hypothetical protein F5883DRAFT_615668, partial [Diaporthe sp. PMI_573]